MAPKPYFRAIFPIFRIFFPIFWERPFSIFFLFFFPISGRRPETYSVAGQRGRKNNLTRLKITLRRLYIPRPHPDPTQHPEMDPKQTRNRPETEPKRSRNGAEMDRNQALWGGTAGGVCRGGGGGGCKGKRKSLHQRPYRRIHLVAPYRTILRYYRCDTPYRAISSPRGPCDRKNLIPIENFNPGLKLSIPIDIFKRDRKFQSRSFYFRGPAGVQKRARSRISIHDRSLDIFNPEGRGPSGHREVSTRPKSCDTPSWHLASHRHTCAIPHFAAYRAIIMQYPIQTSTRKFFDTIATSILWYEKYRCWGS